MAHATLLPAAYAGLRHSSATEQQEVIQKKCESAEGRWIQLDAGWQLTRDQGASQGTQVTCSSSLYSSVTTATCTQHQAASRPPAAPGLAAAAAARSVQARYEQQQPYGMSASAAAAAAYASMQAAPSSYGSHQHHHPAAAPAMVPPQLYKEFRSSHMGPAAAATWQYACFVPEMAPSSSAPSSGGSAYSGFKADSVGSVSPGCPFQHVWNGSGAGGATKGSMGKPTRLSLASYKQAAAYGSSAPAAGEEEEDLKCCEDMNTSPGEEMVLCDMRDSQDSSWLHCAGGGTSSVTSGRHQVPQWSVKSRLHVAEVSVYTDATCPEALRISNAIMSRIHLPGGVVYLPVDPDALLQQAAVAWQFPAMAVCLGSSYFQRLLVSRRQLAAAALKVPSFEAYCRQLPAPSVPTAPASEVEVRGLQSTLRSILFTCLFLALKLADQLHARGLLPYMLTAIAGGVTASNEEALEIEARCLEGLEWRLGPYFAEDDLQGHDAELWLTAWQV